ncbi:MAG: acyltransferase [Gemmatimonadales bacterium]|nr:acyltransferase [Gemmatimonadales bacterium]
MRTLLKHALNMLAVLCAAPLALCYHLLSLVGWGRRDDVFQGFTQLLSLGPGLPGDYLRRGFLYLTCKRCALSSSVGFGTIFASPEVVINEHVYIGPMCSIGHAIIGRDTMLGTGVHLIGGGHAHASDRLDLPMRLQPRDVTIITIGVDCWVGNGAVVMADLGSHVIVGAGAVVTRPVAEWLVVAGSPARALRDRRQSHQTDNLVPGGTA